MWNTKLMSDSKSFRKVYICESYLKTSNNSFPAPPMHELLKDVRTKFTSNSLQKHELDYGKRIYRLRDIQDVGDNCYGLLVSMSNEDIPDNVLEEKNSGSLRVARSADNESPALSAHVLIRYVKNDPNSFTYETLIEKINGLGLSSIQGLLRNIFRQTYPEKVKDKTGKLKVYAPLIEFRGHPSSTISNILNEDGKLSGVTFLTTKPTSYAIQEDIYHIEETSSLVLKVQDKPKGQKAIDFLKKHVLNHKDKFEDAKITIAFDNGTTKTSPIFMDQHDITNNFFRDCIFDKPTRIMFSLRS